MAKRRTIGLTAVIGLLLWGAMAAQAQPVPDDGRPKPPSGKAKFEQIVDMFSVTAVAVDVRADTVLRARDAALIEAQRRAWRKLWSRMANASEGSAPSLGDTALKAVVVGVDVVSEAFSTKRYIGVFNIRFDPIAVRRFSGAASGYLASRSRPLLVLPVLKDGGVTMVYDPANPWATAWIRHPLGASLIDYVRAEGEPLDSLLLTAWAASRRDIDVLQIAYERYRAEGLIVAAASLDRRYPGGPIIGRFNVYQGAGAASVLQFQLVAPSPRALDGMLAQAIDRIDSGLNALLRQGAVSYATTEQTSQFERATPSIDVQRLDGLDVAANTPDAAAITTIQARLRAARTVTAVFATTMSPGGVSRFRVASSEGQEWLLYELDQVGLRLDPTGSGWTVRDRRPDDVPIPQPAPPLAEAVSGEEAPPTITQ